MTNERGTLISKVSIPDFILFISLSFFYAEVRSLFGLTGVVSYYNT